MPQNIVSRYVQRRAAAPIGETSSATANDPALKWFSFGGRHFPLSEGNLFLLLAIVIGIFSGLAVVCFRMAIEWVHLALLGSTPAPSPLRVLLVPAGAGLVSRF